MTLSPLPNHTRTSPSIPKRLLREGKLHLLPVYALMRTSDLGREGIENQGSFRFSDHVYRNEPSGRFLIGHDCLLVGGVEDVQERLQHLPGRRFGDDDQWMVNDYSRTAGGLGVSHRNRVL